MSANEIWVQLKDFEGLYEISNFGRIKSLPKKGSGKEFILKQAQDKCGYKKVRLSKDNKKYSILVHRAVAATFIPNLENKPQVNHKNGDKTNNNASNLEWVTNSENQKHAIHNNLVDNKKLIEHVNTIRKKSIEKTSVKIRRSDGVVYNSISEAANDVGVDRSVISRVLSGVKGKRTAGGYGWEYV